MGVPDAAVAPMKAEETAEAVPAPTSTLISPASQLLSLANMSSPKRTWLPWSSRIWLSAARAMSHFFPPPPESFMLSERSSTMSTLGTTGSAWKATPLQPQ